MRAQFLRLSSGSRQYKRVDQPAVGVTASICRVVCVGRNARYEVSQLKTHPARLFRRRVCYHPQPYGVAPSWDAVVDALMVTGVAATMAGVVSQSGHSCNQDSFFFLDGVV